MSERDMVKMTISIQHSKLGTEAEGVLDNRSGQNGTLLRARLVSGNTGKFFCHWEMALDFVERALNATGVDGWRSQKSGLGSLLRNFFQPAREERAWITVTPVKPQTNYAVAQSGMKAADHTARVEWLGKRPQEIKVPGLSAQPLGELQFGPPRDGHARRVQFVALSRERFAVNGADFSAIEYPVFLADPSADEEDLDRGWVPVQRDAYDKDRYVLRVPHIILGKADEQFRYVEQFNIGLLSGTALLTSLMYGFRDGQFYLSSHPIDAKLLDATSNEKNP